MNPVSTGVNTKICPASKKQSQFEKSAESAVFPNSVVAVGADVDNVLRAVQKQWDEAAATVSEGEGGREGGREGNRVIHCTDIDLQSEDKNKHINV